MGRILRGVIRLPAALLIGLVRLYQVAASPFPSPCRHTPSCSTYTLEAIRRFGAVRGGWLGIRRIVRCNPFMPGGHDPVPEIRHDG